MIRKVLFAGLIASVTFGFWTLLNRPVAAPVWTGAIDGFAYAPFRPGQSPARGQYPSASEIEADIAIIAQHATSLRSYGIDGTLAEIPGIASRYDLPVTLGISLSADEAANRAELAKLAALVAQSTNIERVIIGNETLLTETLTPAALIEYIAAARAQLDVPVSTAEPWHIWLQYPALADQVDYLAVHLLPYWEAVPADASVALVADRMDQLQLAFDKPVVIGEVGWPSHGRSRGAAAASRREASVFLRQYLNLAAARGYDYFLMEAFDQPWKRADEGAVGAYWGFFDGAREPKFVLDRTLIPLPQAGPLALIAALLGTVGFLLLSIDSGRTRSSGIALFAATALVVGNAIVWTLYDFLYEYWTPGSLVVAMVLVAGLLGIVLLVFTEVHEWVEASCKQLVRLNVRAPDNAGRRWPKVSVHVPAYAEPPAMLIETLNALARLDYPDYEVLVIDNNTCDEALWRPVEAHCKRLGNRFRFFHVAPLGGYKAGALNFALERTAADAEIIAVLDSDYVVEPHWLESLVPHFSNPNVALVQAPQDYRDQRTRIFKSLCEAEYRGFFHTGMVARNERNAIIQHGTMTMIRADVLREVGGWADWTVTEDAELGLRILAHGYESIYTNTSYGRGLTPDRFRDYRSQRFRWAIGAMQILRAHGRRLLGLAPSSLTPGQRFHFLAGWAAWLGDGLNLLFNLIAVAWSVVMLLDPLAFPAPTAKLTGLVPAFFAFKLVKMAWLYGKCVRASVPETLAAMLAGLAVVFTTGLAILCGLASRDARFVRTPKLAARDSARRALGGVTCETVLAIVLPALAVGVMLTAPWQTLERQLWCALLLVFAVPHVAAVVLSLLGAAPADQRRQDMRSRSAASEDGTAVTARVTAAATRAAQR